MLSMTRELKGVFSFLLCVNCVPSWKLSTRNRNFSEAQGIKLFTQKTIFFVVEKKRDAKKSMKKTL